MTSRNGTLAGAAGAQRARASRSPRPARRRSTAPTSWRCTPTAPRSTRRWVTVHDTATDGTPPFNANALALATGGTPFKRPENGQFRPGSDFSEFYFDETGDTDATSPENDTRRRLGLGVQAAPDQPVARTPARCRCSTRPTSRRRLRQRHLPVEEPVTFVQDAGDTLHTQANALDSGWVFDVTKDYCAARRDSRSAGSPRAATRRPRSTPPRAARATRATTRSPASTSPTGTRPPAGSSAPRSPISTTRSGAGSTPSNTATTPPTR